MCMKCGMGGAPDKHKCMPKDVNAYAPFRLLQTHVQWLFANGYETRAVELRNAVGQMRH